MTELERGRIETRTRAFQEQLAAILSHPEFGRMDLTLVPLFLFNALRVLIFSVELRQGRWRLPAGPAETVQFLIERTPLLPAFPRKLREHYDMAMRGDGCFDERLMPKSRTLLAEMVEISQHGRSWESLRNLNGMADEHRLNISAAIITANRPLQLKRCLASLAGLIRSPEELVVVDSGRDLSARQIIETVRVPFPIRYVRIDPMGVASGRNAAVREARGEIIAFVDDDATVEPDWLDRLERVFLRDPRVGLASGAIMNMNCGRKDWIWQFMQTAEKL